MHTSLLDIITALGGYKKQSSKTWEGPCPRCGGNDRFIVWIHEDRFSCRGCDFKGDIITWLRQVEGKNCGEAHLAADKRCDSHDCEAYGKCAATRDGSRAPRTDKQRKLGTPSTQNSKLKTQNWQPTVAVTPEEQWQERALALVTECHEALLASPEQLDYLEKRGLPRGAVEKYRLGWLGKDLFKSRASWGLSPTKQRRDGTETSTLWIPAGIVIPMFDSGFYSALRTPHSALPPVHRIRIRRPKIKGDEMRYYWLEGSGDDTWMLNPDAKAQIVIETDLDGLMIDWHAGDIVGAVPLGSCSPRPKQNAAVVLDNAVCILNALDFEPRVGKTGRNEAPGGENWLRFWKPRYPQAKRHPAPGGKDAGEAYQNGTNLRAWIIAGLPAGLRPPAGRSLGVGPATPAAETNPPIPETKPPKTETKAPESNTTDMSDQSQGLYIPHSALRTPHSEVPMRLIEGREIYFPSDPADWRRLVREGKIVVGPKETKIMAEGLPYQVAEALLLTKEIFPGAFLSGIEKIS